jgi:hypothetical protein
VLSSALGCNEGHCGPQLTANGSWDFLKHANHVNSQFDYEGMTVLGDKKAKPQVEAESEYVKRKEAEFEMKKTGEGKSWREHWFGDRTEAYQPKFNELLNKTLNSKKMPLEFGSFQDAKYALILKTVHTQLGWKFSAIIQRPFLVNLRATFVETQNPTNVIAEVVITKCEGNVGHSEFFNRDGLTVAYGNAGKELGSFISKELK